MRGRNAGAQVLRRFGLAEAGDIVQLAFDAQQCGAGDRAGIHAFTLHVPLAARQQEFLEDHADRVQVVLGRHVEHRVVLVVETTVRVGIFHVALDQVGIEIPVRTEVAARVHRQEPGVLQEAGVHAAAGAGEGGRHGVDDIVLEPGHRVLRGQIVDRGRAAARIDRATHHHQRPRRGFATAGHQRDGGKHRHGRLADADHVQLVRTEVADEFLHIGDVVIQPELAFAARHHARIDPVGHVHAVIAQQGAHGIAQQRGVVAGQRRYHQHERLVEHGVQLVGFIAVALEAQQFAERLADLFVDDDRHALALDVDFVDAPFGLLVILADAVEQLVHSGQAIRAGHLRPPMTLIGEELRVGLGLVHPRGEQVAGQLMQLI